MTRILVTGINGFAGRHLAPELSERGISVAGMVAPDEVVHPEVREYCHELLTADLLDKESLERTLSLASPSCVVHMAALSAPSQSFNDPTGFYKVNVEGTQNLLEAVRQMPESPRLVIFGSSDIYGYVTEDELPLLETSELRPANPYAVTKVANHMTARQYSMHFGLEIVEARPFNMIGPGQQLGFVLPDFASQVAAIAEGKQEPAIHVGRLSDERDFLDIRDAASAIADVILHGVAGEAYNICSGTALPVSALLDGLLANVDADITITRDEARIRPSKMPIHYGNNSKLRALNGWEPRISLDQTIQETLEFWRDKLR